MNNFDDALKEMDFDFLGSGKHAMNVETMRRSLADDHFLFVDVRTKTEQDYLTLPFACHIPLNELPTRWQELPRERCIVTFCSSVFRGAVAYTYLRGMGFKDVKILTASMEDIVSAFKPGPLAKMLA